MTDETKPELKTETEKILETRRERWEDKQYNKTAAYERLAQKNQQEGQQRYDYSNSLSDNIPLGQPILIGHHSEKRHRRDLARIQNNTIKAFEKFDKAKYYEEKLASLENNTTIYSDDPDAISKLQAKLADMQEAQEHMKSANKIIRKKISDAEKVIQLQELGLSEERANKLLLPDFCNRIGYADYKLQNNNANIRRVKERIEELTKALEQAAEEPIDREEYLDINVTLIRDRELNRIQLMFIGKPSEEVRKLLKSNGFRWSPSNSAWQRQLNNSGEYNASIVINKLRNQN